MNLTKRMYWLKVIVVSAFVFAGSFIYSNSVSAQQCAAGYYQAIIGCQISSNGNNCNAVTQTMSVTCNLNSNNQCRSANYGGVSCVWRNDCSQSYGTNPRTGDYCCAVWTGSLTYSCATLPDDSDDQYGKSCGCKKVCPSGNGQCGVGSDGAPKYNCKGNQCDDDDGPPECITFKSCHEDCKERMNCDTNSAGKKVNCKKEYYDCKEICVSDKFPKCNVRETELRDCIPKACPVGTTTVPSRPGETPVTTTSCQYYKHLSTNCSNGKCQPSTKVVNCYATFTDPPTSELKIIDHPQTTTLGCFAQGVTGVEVNNSIDIEFDVTDTNGADDVKAFMVWFAAPGSSPPAINQLGSGNSVIQSNNSFGFMIGQINNSWRVFTPRFNSNSWRWINRATIGNGDRARIAGQSGADLALIKDVTVMNASTNVKRLKVKLEILHEGSGVSSFESPMSHEYRVYAAASDASRFFQGSEEIMAQAPTFTQMRTWTIDVHNPTQEELSHSVQTADRLNLNWNFTDSSGIKRVIGNAVATGEGTVRGPIDNITANVNGYVLGSAPTGTNLYSGSNLWGVNNLNSRSELIDIGNNEGNVFEFVVHAFDNACNAGEYVYNMDLGSPWIITKGGVVYSAGGSSINVQTLEGNEPFAADSYWSGAFGFKKDESDLSTELLTGGGTSLTNLINSVRLSSTRAIGYNDSNNRSGYWFRELTRRVNNRNISNPEGYTKISFLTPTTLSGSTSDIVSPTDSSAQCNTDTSCIVSVAGNLTIEQGFICDTRTTFLVTGDIAVNPNVTSANASSGCMFISSNDITIGAGQYQSSGSTYPKYDIVDGYFVADGNINIPQTDQGQDVRDGLIVRGGLVGFGSEGNRSIVFGRTLKLMDNNAFPTLAVHFDNRYLNFATVMFGGHTETFKKEIGFKPL